MGGTTDEQLPELSDFEYVTYRDDSVHHPMVMILRLHLDGSLQIGPFQNSLRQALTYHPLLRSTIRKVGRHLYWQTVDRRPPITIAACSQPDDHCALRYIDLTSECGAAFDLRIGTDRTVLVCHFHHACVDGVGAIRFLADAFALYGQQLGTQPEPPEVVEPDPQLLKRRGECPEFGADTGERKSWTEWLRGPARFLLGTNYCIPQMGPAVEESVAPVASVLHTAVIKRPTVRKLKQLAATKGVSTNDLCMLVYLQQIAWWTNQHRHARDNDLFRILMPVSLRTAELDRISAANVLSYVYQTFKRRHCRNSEALLSAIHQRSSDMLHSNEAAIFLKLFRLVRRFPFLMNVSRRLQPAFATAVLANVGELKRIFGQRFPLKQGRVVAGNVLIRRLDGIAPLRKHTNLAISFGGYGGELILNLRANPECLTFSDAAGFLQQVVDRLTQMAEQQNISAGLLNREYVVDAIGTAPASPAPASPAPSSANVSSTESSL